MKLDWGRFVYDLLPGSLVGQRGKGHGDPLSPFLIEAGMPFVAILVGVLGEGQGQGRGIGWGLAAYAFLRLVFSAVDAVMPDE